MSSRLDMTIGPPLKRRREPEKYGESDVTYSAVSQIVNETFSFLWELKSYSQMIGQEYIKSPIFYGGNANHAWQLKIHPKKKVGDDEFFGAHLVLVEFGDENEDHISNRQLKANFQISILRDDDTPGKQAGSIDGPFRNFEKLSVWGYPKFILTSKLGSPDERFLLANNVLKIHCRVRLEGELKQDVFIGGGVARIPPKHERIQRELERMSKDFRALLTSGVSSDIKIQTGSREFSLHKAVLSARSEVFAAMFQGGKGNESSLKISDEDEEAVQGMFEYMYANRTDMLNCKTEGLLQLAEKYGIPKLKEECEIVMSERINLENAAEILVISRMYNCNIIKPRVIEFIQRHRETLTKMESFRRIVAAYPETAVDLYLAD